MMTQDLQVLEQEIELVDTTDSADQVAELLNKVQFYQTRMKELSKAFNEQFQAWLEENGDLTIGEDRYYVGTTKKTTPKDLPAAVEAVLTAVGGDFDAFCKALSSGALKHGHCKAVLGDEWAEHFDVTTINDIKTGKPKRGVRSINERFLPKQKGQ